MYHLNFRHYTVAKSISPPAHSVHSFKLVAFCSKLEIFFVPLSSKYFWIMCRYLMDPKMEFVKFFGKNNDVDSLADGVIKEIKQYKKVKAWCGAFRIPCLKHLIFNLNSEHWASVLAEHFSWVSILTEHNSYSYEIITGRENCTMMNKDVVAVLSF